MEGGGIEKWWLASGTRRWRRRCSDAAMQRWARASPISGSLLRAYGVPMQLSVPTSLSRRANLGRLIGRREICMGGNQHGKLRVIEADERRGRAGESRQARS